MDNVTAAPLLEPDSRALYWVNDLDGMDELLKDLALPGSLPPNVLRAFTTIRDLLQFSFFRFEFAALAAFHSIIEVESALDSRYRGTLKDKLDAAQADGTISAEQADLLHSARRLRNDFAHGNMQHPALPLPFAVRMVRTSVDLVTALTE